MTAISKRRRLSRAKPPPPRRSSTSSAPLIERKSLSKGLSRRCCKAVGVLSAFGAHGVAVDRYASLTARLLVCWSARRRRRLGLADGGRGLGGGGRGLGGGGFGGRGLGRHGRGLGLGRR